MGLNSVLPSSAIENEVPLSSQPLKVEQIERYAPEEREVYFAWLTKRQFETRGVSPWNAEESLRLHIYCPKFKDPHIVLTVEDEGSFSIEELNTYLRNAEEYGRIGVCFQADLIKRIGNELVIPTSAVWTRNEDAYCTPEEDSKP